MGEDAGTRQDPKRPGRLRRVLRYAGLGLGLLVLLVLLGAGGFVFHLRGAMQESLPPVSGTLDAAGLEAAVEVERDRFGVPTLRGDHRRDLAFALGFVHAQDRFFQMDLLRRAAAGENGELLGSPAFVFDRRLRPLRYRQRARRALAESAPDVRDLVTTYTAGVNAGLASLDEPPFEYAALWTRPRPWTPEDTFLVVLSLFFELQDVEGWFETGVAQTHQCLPDEMADFLTPRGTEWDAPLVGDAIPTPSVPSPEVYSLGDGTDPVDEAETTVTGGGPPPDSALERPGSNAWAVAAERTLDGRALLANDVHMGMTMPNLWYRAALVWPRRRVVGFTIPGIPVVLIGSNGAVAWGVTNAAADTVDVVELEVDPDDPSRYRTPSGWRSFEIHRETLRGRGGQRQEVEYSWTLWGRRIEDDALGRPRALRTLVDEPGAVDLELWRLETAESVEQALDAANRSGVPPQNFLVADVEGRIGWTLLGRLPQRVGFDGWLPGSWADGSRRWQGLLPPEEMPRVTSPSPGFLWSANNRPVGGEAMERLGHGGFLLGARALQIRDVLEGLDQATARDMAELQLDDRAPFFDRWRDLLLRVLPRTDRTRELLDAVEAWNGRASVDSVAFRAVWRFREIVTRDVFEPILEPCRKLDPRFRITWATSQYEGPLWRLLTERPAHLLPPGEDDWDGLLRASALTTVNELTESGPLSRRTWGEINSVQPHHAFSLVAPPLSRWLDPPARPLPGGYHMPRLQTPSFGANLRLVVSPGREEDGWVQMPGGQSGNPRSTHYADLHDGWARGDSVPLLPGPPQDVLTLVPMAAGRESP